MCIQNDWNAPETLPFINRIALAIINNNPIIKMIWEKEENPDHVKKSFLQKVFRKIAWRLNYSIFIRNIYI
jgi:hypothetical protein